MAIPLTKTQNSSDTQQGAPTKPWMAVGRTMQERMSRFFTNVYSVFELTQQMTEKCSCLFCIHAIPGVKLKKRIYTLQIIILR
jgi:hypothetical protein